MTGNQNVDEAWKALADPVLNQSIKRRRSEIQALAGSTALILVARVTVGDETLIVRADEITAALTALNGEPKAGMRLNARIEFDAMTPAEFASIPEYQ
ncbi:hypothetical protein LJR034_008701 [Caballeronia sp. LjRoot34]|uniref:hypothetical protein n=1 Tax=Caballeronia sp. LjRoot34 TaxID=3342325 RepID=UPI003ECD7CB7